MFLNLLKCWSTTRGNPVLRKVILYYWEIMSREIPRRFEMEASRLAGCPKLELPRTFTVLLEAVEVTALQRGCPLGNLDALAAAILEPVAAKTARSARLVQARLVRE
jgi:hypothetical protein